LSISRPVVAFALLKECSEVLRTDLLGGISLLVKPLIADLAGQRFSSELLAERISSSYGIAIGPQALLDFLPRFLAAGLVVEKKISDIVTEVVYSDVDTTFSDESKTDESDFQNVFDKFTNFCTNYLALLGLELSEQELISGLLTRLATFDFNAIGIKPDRSARDFPQTKIILGPSAKEDIEVEGMVSKDARLDVLVAAFVNHVADTDKPTLELLVKVAEGALGAELVFDLQAPNVKSDLSKVTVILDTPIILSLLDLSDHQQHTYALELTSRITETKASMAVFSHSIKEAEGVLFAVRKGIMAHGQAYGPTAYRLSDSAYRTYFETMIGAVETRLAERGIPTLGSTQRYQYFTGDEEEELAQSLRFHLLEKRIARERDASSVAETMRLRAGAHVPLEKIESCRYLFVTSNAVLQNQARGYLIRKAKIDRSEFSPIVTDRYLLGLIWLVFGGSSIDQLSTAKLLANCSAALRVRPDVISKTKMFLSKIDPEKLAHFEALMTKERAARYMTEITLGDSLLITEENASEIYERVESIAAEKVARQKDEFYEQAMSNKDGKIGELEVGLAEAQENIERMTLASESKDAELRHHESQIELLGGELKKTERQFRKETEEVNRLSSNIEALSVSAKRAEDEALRAKRTAIILSLEKARTSLWVRRVLVLIGFVGSGILLGYLDKFILPSISSDYKGMANVALLVSQAVLGAMGFWVFTDKLFGASIWRFSRKKYEHELAVFGYDDNKPEFEIDFDHFSIKE